MKNYKEITNELIQHLEWNKVKETVPFSYQILNEESMKDKQLSTIRPSLWECSTGFLKCNGEVIQVNSKFRRLLKDIGITEYTMQDAICILKEIAKKIIEKEEQTNEAD